MSPIGVFVETSLPGGNWAPERHTVRNFNQPSPGLFLFVPERDMAQSPWFQPWDHTQHPIPTLKGWRQPPPLPHSSASLIGLKGRDNTAKGKE